MMKRPSKNLTSSAIVSERDSENNSKRRQPRIFSKFPLGRKLRISATSSGVSVARARYLGTSNAAKMLNGYFTNSE